MPVSLTVWRQTTQFLGGQTTVLAALTIFAGGGILALYHGEARDGRVFPSVRSTARLIWLVSVWHGAVGTGALWLVGVWGFGFRTRPCAAPRIRDLCWSLRHRRFLAHVHFPCLLVEAVLPLRTQPTRMPGGASRTAGGRSRSRSGAVRGTARCRPRMADRSRVIDVRLWSDPELDCATRHTRLLLQNFSTTSPAIRRSSG